MLLINARVRKSHIHGLGLFADQNIPKGNIIWKFQPGFDVEIPEEDLPTLSIAAQEQVLHYACYEAGKRRFILSSDDDRFSNHADDPNTIQDGETMYACRDIKYGEEITCNYREVVMLNYRPTESV
jgi:SET domain-containing protein